MKVPPLPHWEPVVVRFVNPDGYDPRPINPQGVCPVSRLGEWTIVDWRSLDTMYPLPLWHEAWLLGGPFEGRFEVIAWKRADHPNMSEVAGLPHVPRAVKQLYRAEFQLRLLRATDIWGIGRAEEDARCAWQAYWLNQERAAA